MRRGVQVSDEWAHLFESAHERAAFQLSPVGMHAITGRYGTIF